MTSQRLQFYIELSRRSANFARSMPWLCMASLCVMGAGLAPDTVIADDAAGAGSTAIARISPLATTGPKPGKITPPSPEQIDAAIHRGIKFLLDDQRPDGSWGSAEKTKGLNIYAPGGGA
jgi:squalene cyclase